MTREWDPFEEDLLEWLLHGLSGVSRRQANAAVTALLLFAHPTRTVRAAVRASMSNGRLAIDANLFNTFLLGAPRKIRLRAACTAAAREASAEVFRRLYKSAVIRRRLGQDERLLAACALEGRLNFWPSEAESYAAEVRSLLHDSNPDVALHALPSVAKLTVVERRDVGRVVQLLGRAKTRLSALSALNSILGHRAFALSALEPTFWKKIERLATAKDQWVRDGASRLLSLRSTGIP